MPQFNRYIGVDYSGAETADSNCRGLRVFMAEGSNEPTQFSHRPAPLGIERAVVSLSGSAKNLGLTSPPSSASTTASPSASPTSTDIASCETADRPTRHLYRLHPRRQCRRGLQVGAILIRQVPCCSEQPAHFSR
jgi:hypothetical protein